MRRLTIFVLVLAALYSGYWFLGARTVAQTAEAQIADLRAQGWSIAYDDLSVRGFPSRFDTSVTALDLQSPDGQIGYQAPFVQAFALSYQPNKLIAAFPDDQVVMLGGQPLTIQSSGLRASTALAANTALALDQMTVEADEMRINSASQTLKFTHLLGAIRASGPLPNSYDAYVNAQNITLPEAIREALAAGDLPDMMEVASADATVVLDRPIDRHTLPQWERDPGKLRGLTLRSLNVTWGPLTFGGNGDIMVDANGIPDGVLTLELQDWQAAFQLAFDTDLVPDNARFFATAMGTNLSGGNTDLSLPIRFQNGNMSIGPYPVGPAPNLH